MRIVFSNEKIFDFDGIYDRENACIWAANREEANRRGGKKNSKENFPKK